MTVLDLLELIPTESDFDIPEAYMLSLRYLNDLKCSRYNAMYFGSMSIGNSELFSYKNKKDFMSKYHSACLHVAGDLYNEVAKDNLAIYIETGLFILHSMLAAYVNSINYESKELNKLLKENDKYKSTVDLKGEKAND